MFYLRTHKAGHFTELFPFPLESLTEHHASSYVLHILERGWVPGLLPKVGSEHPCCLFRPLIIQLFCTPRIHLGTRIVLLLRESGPVGPELNYCICGA